jgi:membrane dipeptidase
MRPFRAVHPYLIDLHEDVSGYYSTDAAGFKFPVEDFAANTKGRHADIPKYKKANVKLVFASIFPGTNTVDPQRAGRMARLYKREPNVIVTSLASANATAMEHIKIYYALLKEHTKDLMFVEKLSDLSTLFRSKKTGFLLTVEGADPLGEVEDLELLFRLGVRAVHLSWNYDNRYSANWMSRKDYGLTGEGEELVKRANELGIIVDMSHASKKAALETLGITKLPAIFSHSNSRAVYNHGRNVDDEILELLKQKEGVVGFTMISSTIGRKPSANSLADHIIHVYESFGPDILAIGTDFLGIQDIREPEGLEDVTKLISLWQLLHDRGMSKADVEKISYRNALRVITKNAARWN